ncbi:MAG: dephospho-CoA kinase [Pseudobdellovibrionaceae bacterium]|nr:dephospho-CoA kinase [Bdellovibrionales bacterium]USN46365.1 MAG: dephospho-CoA kinase [Pseudobdellovibrionaceae bacterium]
MKWVGLTGGIASGKSTVSKILRDLGYPVIDADILARQAVARGSQGYRDVINHFGPGVIGPDGEINRSALGAIVFSDEVKRRALEAIVHPKVQELQNKQRRELEQSGQALAFYDVPLLFEKNLQDHFDATVLIYAPEALQRQRIEKRDGLDDASIDQRLGTQWPIDDKLEKANYVIKNEGSLADLKTAIKKLVNDLMS